MERGRDRAYFTLAVIELPGGMEVVSVITKHSAEHLALTQGKDVYAVIKASNVMVMTTDRLTVLWLPNSVPGVTGGRPAPRNKPMYHRRCPTRR